MFLFGHFFLKSTQKGQFWGTYGKKVSKIENFSFWGIFFLKVTQKEDIPFGELLKKSTQKGTFWGTFLQ